MAYDEALAEKVKTYLTNYQEMKVEEKKMFGGIAFLVNGKMCINVTDTNLMCRFDPALQQEISARTGFEPMVMRGRLLDGYCYVRPEGFETTKDFDFWMKLCLDYNPLARPSGKR